MEEGKLSEPFHVGRGVKQGSVLSSALFLLVMDPLLLQLEKSGSGLTVNEYYAGGFLHADDIQTLTSSIDSLEAQVSIVQDFTKVNIQKYHLVGMPPPVESLNVKWITL